MQSQGMHTVFERLSKQTVKPLMSFHRTNTFELRGDDSELKMRLRTGATMFMALIDDFQVLQHQSLLQERLYSSLHIHFRPFPRFNLRVLYLIFGGIDADLWMGRSFAG